MSSTDTPPKWFMIVSTIGLLWNLLGVAAYLAQVTMSPEAMAALPADQRDIYASTPAWANGAFAIAVWAGAGGSLALLLKKSVATPLLVASLLGVLIQMFHSFFLSNSFEVFGPGGLIMPAMVLIIACYLLWLSTRAKANGWLS